MRRFGVLLGKEIRELATAQILVPFIITIAVFVLIGNVVGQQGEDRQSAAVTVMDQDVSAQSSAVVSALKKAGFRVSLTDPSGPGDAAREQSIVRGAADDGASVVLIIPAGFGEGLSSGERVGLRSYAVTRDFSYFATRDAGELKAAIAAVNMALSDQAIKAAAPDADPQALKEPVSLEEHVVVGEKTAKVSAEEVVGFISGQTTFIPIVLFVVIVFAAQMIATSVASEKENKTLETLLSTPVPRWALVTAKMVAAGLVALLSAAAYMAGMRYYMESLTTGLGDMARAGAASEAVMEQLGLTLGPADYALLGLTLFAGILVALAIALILGAFAENVKAVQSLLTPLMVLIMIPYFLTLFIDIRTAAPLVRAIVMGIPFTYPFTAAPNLFLGQYDRVWFGIAYEMAWFVAFALLAARVFASDRILTMKLNFSRKK